MKKFKLYTYNLLIGIDQFANVILGGAPDRTISYRAYARSHHKGWDVIRQAIDLLFWVLFRQANHCQQVFEGGDIHLDEVIK